MSKDLKNERKFMSIITVVTVEDMSMGFLFQSPMGGPELPGAPPRPPRAGAAEGKDGKRSS